METASKSRAVRTTSTARNTANIAPHRSPRERAFFARCDLSWLRHQVSRARDRLAEEKDQAGLVGTPEQLRTERSYAKMSLEDIVAFVDCAKKDTSARVRRATRRVEKLEAQVAAAETEAERLARIAGVPFRRGPMSHRLSGTQRHAAN
jgi:hypothetical protein